MLPQPRQNAHGVSASCDPKAKHLESLIGTSFRFTNFVWPDGDASLPSLNSSRKRKSRPTPSSTSSSGPQHLMQTNNRASHVSSVNTPSDADSTIDKRLKSFKASIIDEVRQLLQQNHENTAAVHAFVNTLPLVSPPTSVLPCRVTRSASAGLSADSYSARSANNKRCSAFNGKQSVVSDPAVDSHNSVKSPVKGKHFTVSPQKYTLSATKLIDTDVTPP